jgi:8-hydroxy-5-deazaflavin:NADPH oxidoreductase
MPLRAKLSLVKIGVLGATGPAGRGLAARLASTGHEVVLGSRDPARAEATVATLRERWGSKVDGLAGVGNADAAEAELVVFAVPWDAMATTAAQYAEAVAGKTVVAMANGLAREGREFHAVLPEGRSISEAVQECAPDANIVAAFQHVPAAAFEALDQPVESDVVVCGNDDGARMGVLNLVSSIPNFRAFDGGSLAGALGIESFAAVLLSVNLRHHGKATLRLLGVDPYQSEQ